METRVHDGVPTIPLKVELIQSFKSLFNYLRNSIDTI